MRAELEPLAAVLRVFDDDKTRPQPYNWAVAARYIDNETIELMGQDKPITTDHYSAIRELCEREGIKRVLIVTYDKHGNRRERWITQ